MLNYVGDLVIKLKIAEIKIDQNVFQILWIALSHKYFIYMKPIIVVYSFWNFGAKVLRGLLIQL
jgi:ABC-type multidrug transport system permease subunit